jgi:hypothetical protein
MHKVQIAPSAEGDLLDGYAFYELQDPGLYRTASKRFPFSIYYQFDDKTATVAAVLDARRNPKTLRRVLSDRH